MAVTISSDIQVMNLEAAGTYEGECVSVIGCSWLYSTDFCFCSNGKYITVGGTA